MLISSQLHRLRTAGIPLLLLTIFFWGGNTIVTAQATKTPASAGAEKLGWHLGAQVYTFKSFTFYEAVDKTVASGMRYIEVFPGQKLAPDDPTLTRHDMSAEARRKMIDKCRAAGVTMQAYGVVNGANPDEWRRIFEFCRQLGIGVVVAEPKAEDFDTLDKLTEEFKIDVAIHNHPEPSHYWNPETVLAAIKGHSNRIGSCADTGHWMRSGLDPLECLKKLQGHIISLHFKDLERMGKGAHDVPWGTGVGNVKALLAELKRQGFKGGFSAEYEYNWEDSVPDLQKCSEFFYKTADELAAEGK
ncbi:MAG: sugar phosphate isomerase/epimerase [bacterium]|nr:sugar phosphate isomerase/epimerase [bacterium]